MDVVDFVQKINVPILVLGIDGNFVYKNEAFSLLFEEYSCDVKIQKFKNALNMQSCALNSDTLSNYNPIDLALESKCNLKTLAVYQKDNDKFITVFISSTQIENYVLFEFQDYSADYTLEQINKEYEKAQKTLKNLKQENVEYLSTKDRAQEQAIKMALLNRIFEALRQSIDIDVALSMAFKELSDIFGFTKVFYADTTEGTFEIKNIYPQKYNNQVNSIVNIDNDEIKILSENGYVVSNVALNVKESTVASIAESRILLPVTHTSNLIGIVACFLPRKNLPKVNKDMMKAISAQISSAIVQASLFEEINNKNEQLSKAIKELEDTQLQLVNSEKMASLGQLVAGVAHEINTPLASINSNNAIYEKIIGMDTIDKTMTDTMLSMVDTDKEAIKRITNIVKSLKRFVRLDEAELQKANINQELDLTLELLKHETKNRIEIVKNYSDIEDISCYPNMLNQVFMNILMNAIQSIDGQGKIFISTKIEDKKLIVSIKDTGQGMPETVKEKIFKSGFTTKKIGIGTGLGLMISKKIVEKHSGSISFNSELGKGTEFIIQIPV